MTEKIFVITVMIGSAGGTVATLSLLNLLHLILHRRLEQILLREPYYSPGEIGFFSVWPFSTVVTTSYIMLTTVPAIPKMKRFAGFNEPLPSNVFLKILCWSTLLIFIIAALSAVGLISWAQF